MFISLSKCFIVNPCIYIYNSFNPKYIREYMGYIIILDNCYIYKCLFDTFTKWDTPPKWTNSLRQVALILSSLGFICVALTAIRSLRKAFANAGSACSPGSKIMGKPRFQIDIGWYLLIGFIIPTNGRQHHLLNTYGHGQKDSGSPSCGV